MSEQNILEVKDLTKHFKAGKKQIVHAVDGISFTLERGKTLGLVGESGCGKSSCARTIIRMYDPTAGQIILDGTDITNMKQKELMPYRKKMQMIFQDPYASLNARMTVRDIIAEPLLAHKMVKNKEESNELVYPMLDTVDNKVVYIPNGEISAKTITNYSGNDTRRVDLKFTASYGDPPEKVKDCIERVVGEHPLTLPTPEPLIRTCGYGSSSIEYEVRTWCGTEDYWTVYFDLIEQVKEAFDKAGVEMTYDHLNVHVVEK